MKINVSREWIERMAKAEEACGDVAAGETVTDDEYGVCEHGRVVHYRYPCLRCQGWRGYVKLRLWGIQNDVRKWWKAWRNKPTRGCGLEP